MHLKKVEIHGFKSFADRIEIEFKEGITAIVGPNGSGKSNIADAIRWVLGEQSIKTLRGSKMEDVIFSGTDSRRPLGYTEVTITFDNKDGVIPVDYQEVAITRRMFRSGESEYYINKNSCRLKDIKELFMDTGVGKDGYSIIGQGRVDEILSTRPEDRRNIFEEAAGIVKYKTKKIEAEKKLEKTDSNLIRIKDLIYELSNQSENLKEQSEKATIFLQLSNRLKEIEVNLLIRKIDELEKEIDKSKREKEKLQIQMEQMVNKKNEIEEKFNLMKEKTTDLDSSIDSIEEEKAKTFNILNKNKSDLTLLEETEKFFIKDSERLSKEIKELNIRLKELEEEKLGLLNIKSKLGEELDLFEKDYHRKNINLKRLNEEIQLKEKEIEDKKGKAIEVYNLIRDKKSKINSYSSFKENIYKRINQVERDIESLLELEKTNRELLDKIEIEELDKQEEIIRESKYLASLRLEEKNFKDRLDILYKVINQNKADLQGMISNYNLLKNMEEDYEGYYKSVKNLMLACKKIVSLKSKVIGVVADLIKVEEKYEKAIDVGLGGSLQNIVTKDEGDAKYIIDYLRKNKLGRVTFLPISTIKGNPIYISPNDRKKYNILGLGSELVSYNYEYKDILEYLLGRTIVVEDLDDAIVVAKKYNYSYRVVTLKGDIINAGGSMTGGSLPKISGNLLNRKFRIEKIRKDINDLSKLQNSLEEEKNLLKLKIDDKIKTLKEQEEKLQNSNIEAIKIENEKNKTSMELERIDNSLIKYKDEIGKLNLELDRINKDEEKLKEDLNLIDEENKKAQEDIREMMLEFEKVKAIKDDVMKEVTDAKIQMNLIENKQVNNKEKIESVDTELENTVYLLEAKKEELLKKNIEIDNIANEMIRIQEEISKSSILKEKQDKDFMLLREEKDLLMKDYYFEQNRLNKINEEINELAKVINNWNLKETRYSVQLDNINGKLLEDYELEYKDAINLWIEIDDIDRATEKVKRLKNEIKKIGTVNLDSIEDYKMVKERLEFIMKQHEDLLLAKENLYDVIADMESKMKEQFLYSFNNINEKFNEVFSILFNGGKASLVLEDEENILTCGIDIKAQPPGKKLQNLNLLSGGEKSLTAVALLFAILKIKPTPFCILDEIDAALDEANISRYTNYLKNFSHNTQFIMITHRKSTMEMADILYGVTMEEEGISKIISVKLTDNLEEIAS
ncbi:Chromosome partition protein Smc [[Clostridium] ultunense Esp]|uniref:Chromosome partition protein Smc n=1 Tax=[Clostridium] ultunense Esp TaxID=1288971 RepID=M1Z3K5_9FIRM|nr:chromosome segregation protein SMC [Schnuerera ultunensis]CCQ97460.1 Chromosome partition protein Smc [[Clostridium] ultunense Esp]SHD76986.1 Chromosome partition protein Smc [[Clostridium] ultunense Esp]